MTDFKIFRAQSDELFPNGELNPRLIVEDGCWYLCTDTAELFVGVAEESGLTLKRINESDIHHIPVDDLALKSDIENTKQEVINVVVPEVEAVKVTVKEEIVPTITEVKSTTEELKAWVENKEFLQHIDLTGYETAKYEVLPIEGMLVSYRDNEVRINTQHVDIDSLPKQNAGDGSSDKYYYATFRAYAPEGATSVIEGSGDKMDSEHSELAIDTYGRKYTTIWSAIASKNGNTWTKFGDNSTINKYLGFYYNFHWYKDEVLLGTDKVRVILTNNACHDDLVPDAVARRIDDKTSAINTAVTNITNQIQNIENNYVTNDVLENTYVTNEAVSQIVVSEVQTVVDTQIETKVTEVIKDKVDSGEIAVTASAISYGDF